MIKKFEQYIRESIKGLDKFEFTDASQGLIDWWADDTTIECSGNNNKITFYFGIPKDIDSLKEFGGKISSFVDELKIAIDTIVMDNLKYYLEINSSSFNFWVSINFYNTIDFNLLDLKLKEHNYYSEYFKPDIANNNELKKISKHNKPSQFSKISLVVYKGSGTPEENDLADIIVPLVEEVVDGQYKITNSIYNERGTYMNQQFYYCFEITLEKV